MHILISLFNVFHTESSVLSTTASEESSKGAWYPIKNVCHEDMSEDGMYYFVEWDKDVEGVKWEDNEKGMYVRREDLSEAAFKSWEKRKKGYEFPVFLFLCISNLVFFQSRSVLLVIQNLFQIQAGHG